MPKRHKKLLRNLAAAQRWWMHNHNLIRIVPQDQVVLNKELLQENDTV